MNIALLILSPDFQIYATQQGHCAQLYYVDVYKLQGIFYGSGGFGEKRHNIWKIL